MYNKTIWAVLAVTILAILTVFFVTRGGQQPLPQTPTITKPSETSTESAQTTQPETKVEQMVTYSDTGFSPSSITIKARDTITFKNESSKDMWVASAPHPTHTNYPGFDAKAGSSKGEEYMFTFTKSGTWKYHNHLNPSHTGDVVVE